MSVPQSLGHPLPCQTDAFCSHLCRHHPDWLGLSPLFLECVRSVRTGALYKQLPLAELFFPHAFWDAGLSLALRPVSNVASSERTSPINSSLLPCPLPPITALMPTQSSASLGFVATHDMHVHFNRVCTHRRGWSTPHFCLSPHCRFRIQSGISIS